MSMPIVQTNVVGTGLVLTSIGYHDVGAAIAVEIHHSDIARRPARISECARKGEVTFSVVEINELLVWSIIPDDEVKVAVNIQIGENRPVGPICPVAEVVPLVEVALPIVQENEIDERPMATLRQDDVKVAVAVEIAQTHIGGGFCLVLENNGAVKVGDPGT